MKQIIFAVMLLLPALVMAQKVSVQAVEQDATVVFREIVEQTGKNFVYDSDLLKGIKITINARKKPLKEVLRKMFEGTDIEFRIKGKNVILKRRKPPVVHTTLAPEWMPNATVYPDSTELLDEIVVVSRLEAPAVSTTEIGARKVTAEEVLKMPALFGESDVIKTLHSEPGVIDGSEGMAGMYVHGGNADENLYMLDNVPVYQVNHFMGLFSAFNPDIIRYIDFFKSSFPAKYDGRLSSFMDVRLQNIIPEGHHGSARLGLTSGAFNISGPIGNRTSYLVGLRRSWYDVLTIPLFALANIDTEDKTEFRYYFMDLNAKVNHRFSSRLNGFVSVYYGDDLLKTSWTSMSDKENDRLNWGNLIAQAGANYRFSDKLTAEFTAAYTKYFSKISIDEKYWEYNNNYSIETHIYNISKNNISDWIFRGDFDWQPADHSRVRFGAGYTRHKFLPRSNYREYNIDGNFISDRDSTGTYDANEVNAYIEDEWHISPSWSLNAGMHLSLFNIDGKIHHGISPRLSAAWRINSQWAAKAAYSRTTQYVHQLSTGYLALPTDRWIPITGDFKPQTADKISIGGYWQTPDGAYTASAEAYYKYSRNLIDYRDEYYLGHPMDIWNSKLTSGKGTAKGIDFKVEKTVGKVTGFVAYSLAWADRTFKDRNGGRTYPARFDNRHTINIVLNWKINEKVGLNASWVGHSGSRFTFMPMVWDGPDLGNNTNIYYEETNPLRTEVNNYQLPFYHRLDLSITVRNRRGYWTFGLYNAYCHKNIIALRLAYKDVPVMEGDTYYLKSKPVFQKISFLPIIPSISYTWQF